MASSDLNRDDYLNEEEFVKFLDQLTGNQFSGLEFAELPTALITTYADLATGEDEEIYIFGSKPGQTATEDQDAFLGQICLNVAIALSGTAGPPGTPSTMDPSPVEAPTFPPGLSEVYNSFIVTNTVGLTAEQLQSGANREGLDAAYGEFALRTTAQLAAVATDSRNQDSSLRRRRKLNVGFAAGTDEIYLLLDIECPVEIEPPNTCQTAYAKFQVTITVEDAQTVSDEYTSLTQDLISEGLLQEILIEVDPRNLLQIADASFPVKNTFPPTAAPEVVTEAPSIAPVEGGGDKKSVAGPVVGGLLGGILFCAAIGYVSAKGLPFSVPSFGGRSKKQADDEDENEGGFGQDDDDKVFGDDDDDDDKEPEQSPDGNMFGFGRKNKPDSENSGFGVDDDDDEDEDAFGEGNKASFDKPGGMYAFDEPSEVADDEEDNDQGSAGGIDDMFGGSSSPGWGNADNAFGSGDQGWGASGTGAPDSGGGNFFGASAFGGEEEGEDDGSRSASESDSYTSSEDSTYQSDEVGGEQNSAADGDTFGDEEGEDDSYSRSSADEGSESYNSGSTPGSMTSELKRKNEDMEAAIESGDWDAVAKAADTFGRGQDSSLEGSSKRESEASPRDGEDENDSYGGSSRSGSASASASGSGASASGTSATTTTEDREKRAEYHAQVDALVRLVLPDETDKVEAMMEQFKGREAELVSTLQTMQERSANQRARAAVHKSKNRPQRPEGADALGLIQGGEGSAAGTAAIAAASLPIPAAGMFDEADGFADDGGQGGFGSQDVFGNDMRGDEDYVDDEERSYYSEEGPFSDEESGSHSQYSGSQSYRSGEGSRSYRSGEGSQSYISGEGSQSYISGEGSQSYISGEGSQSRSGEGSQSYISGEGSQSYISGEGSRSYRSGEGSQSYISGEGSQSYISGEGSQSYRSGDGSQSYHSGEGSGSYRSGEEGSRSQGEGSYYSEEGSRSYYSGEDGSGSYYSDEEGSFQDE